MVRIHKNVALNRGPYPEAACGNFKAQAWADDWRSVDCKACLRLVKKERKK